MTNKVRRSSTRFFQSALWLGAGLSVTSAFVDSAHAAGYQNLAVVKPVMSCEQLAQADLSKIKDARITIKTAIVRPTDKGPYCRVTANVEPGIGFAADFPIEHWTQRYVQGAQGREGIQRAGSCMPALNGEMAVATQSNNGGPNAGLSPPWGNTPQARINSAYMGQHMTAVATKELIRVFYGKPAKFSYMVGCSGGGGQTLTEAQRFPEDFEGFSIGAPPIYDTVHNIGFWHGWEYHINQRADGSIILGKDKLPILHDAAIAHCSAAAGVVDGGLQQPTACKFDKAWVQCATGASDTSKCLTAEEATVAEQLYLGPNDGKGRFFEISGWPLGSELLWRLSTQGKPADGEGLNPNKIHSVLMPPESGQTTQELMAKFTFTQEWFDKSQEMWPLFNITNTNLRPLAKRGSKIVLWIGAEDNVVQPEVAISYYQGVQQEMGVKETDKFLRFFLLPGVGHCGNGDGANQVDILSPLMAWVEMHQDPKVIVAGRPVPATGGPGINGGGGTGPGAAANGGPPAYPPYAEADRETVYTRPIYPFPNVSQYAGKGNANDATNYVAVKGPLKLPVVFTNETSKLIGPDNQKFYRAEDNNTKLVVATKK